MWRWLEVSALESGLISTGSKATREKTKTNNPSQETPVPPPFRQKRKSPRGLVTRERTGLSTAALRPAASTGGGGRRGLRRAVRAGGVTALFLLVCPVSEQNRVLGCSFPSPRTLPAAPVLSLGPVSLGDPGSRSRPAALGLGAPEAAVPRGQRPLVLLFRVGFLKCFIL